LIASVVGFSLRLSCDAVGGSTSNYTCAAVMYMTNMPDVDLEQNITNPYIDPTISCTFKQFLNVKKSNPELMTYACSETKCVCMGGSCSLYESINPGVVSVSCHKQSKQCKIEADEFPIPVYGV